MQTIQKSIGHAHSFGKYWKRFPAYAGATVCLCLLSSITKTVFTGEGTTTKLEKEGKRRGGGVSGQSAGRYSQSMPGRGDKARKEFFTASANKKTVQMFRQTGKASLIIWTVSYGVQQSRDSVVPSRRPDKGALYHMAAQKSWRRSGPGKKQLSHQKVGRKPSTSACL